MGTGINNLTKLIALHSELAALLHEYDIPTTNQPLLAKIEIIAKEAQGADPYCYSCFLHISNEAIIFYSTSKHKKRFYGANESYAKIKMHLDSIHHRINEIKLAQSK